jgi:hypothetical protein
LRHLQDSTARHDAVVDFIDSHPAPATMKDGIDGNTVFDISPPPVPTPVDEDDENPAPTPQPTPEPTPEEEAEDDTPDVVVDEDPDVIEPTPQPDITPTAEVREYVFGTGLFALADGNPEHSVAHWMEQMAGASGTSYATSIQTGMLTLHDNLPPNPHLWIEGVASSWDPESGQSFADANFNQITISEENFTQDQAPDAPDYADPSSSPAEAALRIIAWVEGQAPGATINLYETWPSLEPFADSFPPSAEAFGNWVSYLTGDWHGWWVALHEIICDARPDLDIRLISAGPQIVQMLDELGFAEFTAEDLFQDLSGHGTPTLYFLAATIHYTTLYGTPPNTDIELPDTLHPAVVENYGGVVDWLTDNVTESSEVVQDFNVSVANVTVETSNVTAEAPPETAEAPNVTAEAPPETAEAPNVTAEAPDVSDIPNADVGTPDDSDGLDGTVVVLNGEQSNYTLTMSAGDTISLEDRRPDGDGLRTYSDTVTLEFADGSPATQQGSFAVEDFSDMALLSDNAMDSLTELYIAYFNRAPDATGLSFWGDKLAQGMTMREIAGYFFDQPEPRALYGEDINLAKFVASVYNNVFGRAPDADGFRFWLDALENDDSITPATFIMEVLEGAKAETGSIDDAQYLANKVVLGSHYSVTRGLSNVDTARSVMSQFDGSSESFDTAITEIEAAYADAIDPSDGNGEFIIKLVGGTDDDDDTYADEVESDAQFMRLS